MYIPSPRERVVVEGRSHYYFVVATDPAEGHAYIVDLRDHGYVERIPFTSLSRYAMPGWTYSQKPVSRMHESIRESKSGGSRITPGARDLGRSE